MKTSSSWDALVLKWRSLGIPTTHDLSLLPVDERVPCFLCTIKDALKEQPEDSPRWEKVILFMDESPKWEVRNEHDMLIQKITWEGRRGARLSDPQVIENRMHHIEGISDTDYGLRHFYGSWLKFPSNGRVFKSSAEDERHYPESLPSAGKQDSKSAAKTSSKNNDREEEDEDNDDQPQQKLLSTPIGGDTPDKNGDDNEGSADDNGVGSNSAGKKAPRNPAGGQRKRKRTPNNYNQRLAAWLNSPLVKDCNKNRKNKMAKGTKAPSYPDPASRVRHGDGRTSFQVRHDRYEKNNDTLPFLHEFHSPPLQPQQPQQPQQPPPMQLPPPHQEPPQQPHPHMPPVSDIPPMNLNQIDQVEVVNEHEKTDKHNRMELAKTAISHECSVEDCRKRVVNGGVCVEHGAEVKKKECSVDGCTRQAQNGGVCIRHGAKKYRYECSVEGCTNRVVNGGVCVKHGGEVKKCSVEGCSSQAKNGGLCCRHTTGAKR